MFNMVEVRIIKKRKFAFALFQTEIFKAAQALIHRSDSFLQPPSGNKHANRISSRLNFLSLLCVDLA